MSNKGEIFTVDASEWAVKDTDVTKGKDKSRDELGAIQQKMQWATQGDVEKIWIHEGQEFSHRLVSNKRQGAGLSFHVTTYKAGFDVIVEGRGHDEVVLFCLQGDSRQIIEETGEEVHFVPGMALYLPKVYRYRHIIGENGLVVAVAATPPRQ